MPESYEYFAPLEKAPPAIVFSDKLYGRTEVLNSMHEFWSKPPEERLNLLLIKGSSGVGKSSVVKEFARTIQTENFQCVSGKHDINRNNPPFVALVQTLTKLIQSWMNEPRNKREKIANALKGELALQSPMISRVFPQLSQLFDGELQSHDKAKLNFKDGFNESLLGFLNALGKLETRIILFLDDLQWTDTATSEFLKLWVTEGKAKNICLIGSYRDDEMEHKHWFVKEQGKTFSEEQQIHEIKLDGLKMSEVEAMLKDTLKMKTQVLKNYAELIYQLTGGNPIFIRESQQLLLNDNVLFYDNETELWDFDVTKTKSFENKSDTLEFIINKMKMLPKDTLEILGVASAIGSKFSAAIVSAVLNKPISYVTDNLVEAIDKWILEPAENGDPDEQLYNFKFVHDKMQAGAYEIMSLEKRSWVHFSLGKTYSSSLGYAAQSRNIFDIVNQFNKCPSFFENDKDYFRLIEMNKMAGEKAKESSSFGQSITYFDMAISLVEAKRITIEDKIIFELYLQAGESAYLKSDFVNSVTLYNKALSYAESPLCHAKVHHNFLVMYNGVSDLEQAWDSGIKALACLDVKMPKKIGKGKVLEQFIKIQFLLRKNKDQDLLSREDMTDLEASQTLLTFMEMIASAWDKKPETLAYLVLRGFEVFLKKGNSPIGYFAVSGYGAILGMAFGKIEKGWEYIQLGGKLTDNYDNLVFHGRGNFGVYGTYSHLMIHSNKNIEPLDDAFNFSKSAGDYSIAAYSSIILVENMLTISVDLKALKTKATSFFGFLKRTANYDYLSSHKSITLFADLLMHEPLDLNARILEMDARINRVSFKHIKYTWSVYKLLLFLVLKQPQKAVNCLTDILHAEYRSLSSIEIVSTITLAIAKVETSNKKSKALSYLKKEQKEVKKFAKLNPDNYAQIETLLVALKAEVKGNFESAEVAYNKAINLATKYGYIQFQALFLERLANLQLHNKQKEKAIKSKEKASAAYQTWGAVYKVSLIRKELNELT